MSTWAPSLPARAAGNLTAPLNLGSGAMVAFRLRPVGLLAAWQVDDFYVDPFVQRR